MRPLRIGDVILFPSFGWRIELTELRVHENGPSGRMLGVWGIHTEREGCSREPSLVTWAERLGGCTHEDGCPIAIPELPPAHSAEPTVGAVEPPRDVPNCRDRTCTGAVYERNAAKVSATALADARGECAALERRLVEIRDEAALEIAWLKRELQRNDPRLYKARYERALPTGGKENG